MTRWLMVFLVAATPAIAADNRYPQPVRVGALVGQEVVKPVEAQPLLGRVQWVAKTADGALVVIVQIGSWLPWSHRTVELPLANVAYLGPQLALVDMTRAQLDALPDAQQTTSLPPQTLIQIGLTRPFH